MGTLDRKIEKHYREKHMLPPRRRIGPRGQPYRRIISKKLKFDPRIDDDREHVLHATKGWRINRVR